jgi:hypothetical protein
MKYLMMIGNCLLAILLYPAWVSWRNHERKELIKAAVRCDGGEPGA